MNVHGRDGAAECRVVIVDDHQVVRDGVRWLLEATPPSSGAAFDVLGEAGTVRDGLNVVLRERPDVAIVDSQLPDGRGVDLVRSVRSRVPEIRCMILTSYPGRALLREAVMAGASGLVAKDVPSTVLVDAVRRVAEGGSVVDADLGDELGFVDQPAPGIRDLVDELTPQERRILDLIADGATNQEIADALFLAEKTVRNYVSNLLAKLGVRNRTQAATLLVELEGRHVA